MRKAEIMEKINDGGTAFPWSNNSGMSLRDYFAAHAMMGMLAAPDKEDPATQRGVAEHAYRQADAMLRARKEMR